MLTTAAAVKSSIAPRMVVWSGGMGSVHEETAHTATGWRGQRPPTLAVFEER